MPDPESIPDKWDVMRRSLQDLISGFDHDIKRLDREIDNKRNRIEQIQEHKDRLELVLYKLEKSNDP